MLTYLENKIFELDNEVLAMELYEIFLYFFPWHEAGSFSCWLFGHKNHVADKYCVICGDPVGLQIRVGPRLFERIYLFLQTMLFFFD